MLTDVRFGCPGFCELGLQARYRLVRFLELFLELFFETDLLLLELLVGGDQICVCDPESRLHFFPERLHTLRVSMCGLELDLVKLIDLCQACSHLLVPDLACRFHVVSILVQSRQSCS